MPTVRDHRSTPGSATVNAWAEQAATYPQTANEFLQGAALRTIQRACRYEPDAAIQPDYYAAACRYALISKHQLCVTISSWPVSIDNIGAIPGQRWEVLHGTLHGFDAYGRPQDRQLQWDANGVPLDAPASLRRAWQLADVIPRHAQETGLSPVSVPARPGLYRLASGGLSMRLRNDHPATYSSSLLTSRVGCPAIIWEQQSGLHPVSRLLRPFYDTDAAGNPVGEVQR